MQTKRRKQLEKDIAGRTCLGCGEVLDASYQRNAKYHGEPCRLLHNPTAKDPKGRKRKTVAVAGDR